MANIFSRLEHNPRRFSGVTKDRQREILDRIEAALREELASPRAAAKTSTKHHCWRGRARD